MKIVLFTLLFLVFYTYIGYGLIIFVLNRLFGQRRNDLNPRYDKDVTLLIAAYNEADIIEAKIQNSLALHYPKSRLKIAIVTDGSDDESNEIIRRYPQIDLYYQPNRRGKIHAVNRVMNHIKTPITVFSDANVMLNSEAIAELVKHFDNPAVGAVSGEKVVVSDLADSASAGGEGIYWKYESFLKRMDWEFNTLVGSAGELFAMRSKLYEPIAENTIIEDFQMTMRLTMKGHKVAYEPRAMAMERGSFNISEEEKRKVRISAGGAQAIVDLISILNPFKYGSLTFQYISHRALRWTLAPLALPLIFLLNVLLLDKSFLYQGLFAAQSFFYLLAWGGYLIRNRKTRLKALYIPYYFVFMNICVYKGWNRYLKGSQKVIWDKAQRISDPVVS
jgi:cellulose synthase/poly-beta-1,6-N-acetylglucosamine synthase-like glycosyltransferase